MRGDYFQEKDSNVVYAHFGLGSSSDIEHAPVLGIVACVSPLPPQLTYRRAEREFDRSAANLDITLAIVTRSLSIAETYLFSRGIFVSPSHPSPNKLS